MSNAAVHKTRATKPSIAKAVKKMPESTKTKKIKATSSHPKYSDMIASAIKALNERSGSSRQAILKYILTNYKINERDAAIHVKLSLKHSVKSGALKQIKGNGASGSFTLGKNETLNNKSPKNLTEKKAKNPAGEKKTRTPVESTKQKAAAKMHPENPKAAKERE